MVESGHLQEDIPHLLQVGVLLWIEYFVIFGYYLEDIFLVYHVFYFHQELDLAQELIYPLFVEIGIIKAAAYDHV